MGGLPRTQRVAAYAVVVRDEQVLLSRLAPRLSRSELWTLPGGGLEHGEDPRDAVVREVHEETGLDVRVGDTSRVYSQRQRRDRRGGRRVDSWSLRIVYEGWVPRDAPAPRVVEVDGTTVDAAWHPLAAVRSGRVRVSALVREALADHTPARRQRVGAYALVTRAGGAQVLLTRISARGHHAGCWTLPGGGVDHGEAPRDAVRRELAEECGLAGVVGDVVAVDDVHLAGTAPSGRHEDFHGVHLVFRAEVDPDVAPRVVEDDGTTDAVAWVDVAEVEAGAVEVLEVVRAALTRR
ncbi:NUDIX hydrolase [Nocardioides kribbensis]|uniref:NUDIX domain-containing protein n=1 Tax=Nocardioides kribbensis TaxID=305517 RepID=A0ABV1P0Q1_9ACTN